MIDFLFMDEETEELFIVQAQTAAEARVTAELYFDSAIYLRKLTEQEAEDLGYDTF